MGDIIGYSAISLQYRGSEMIRPRSYIYYVKARSLYMVTKI